jgi:hypothetical protein
MSVRTNVLAFAKDLGAGVMFATKQILHMAKRGSLDQALSVLTREGILRRLARGIYMLSADDVELPSIAEILQLKAKIFSRSIAIDGIDALKALQVCSEGNENITVAVNGKSSSFMVLGVRVFLKGTAMCRVEAGDSKPGLAIRAFAQVRRQSLTSSVVESACSTFNQQEVLTLRKRFAKYMPGWMAALVIHSNIPLGSKSVADNLVSA